MCLLVFRGGGGGLNYGSCVEAFFELGALLVGVLALGLASSVAGLVEVFFRGGLCPFGGSVVRGWGWSCPKILVVSW